LHPRLDHEVGRSGLTEQLEGRQVVGRERADKAVRLPSTDATRQRQRVRREPRPVEGAVSDYPERNHGVEVRVSMAQNHGAPTGRL